MSLLNRNVSPAPRKPSPPLGEKCGAVAATLAACERGGRHCGELACGAAAAGAAAGAQGGGGDAHAAAARAAAGVDGGGAAGGADVAAAAGVGAARAAAPVVVAELHAAAAGAAARGVVDSAVAAAEAAAAAVEAAGVEVEAAGVEVAGIEVAVAATRVAQSSQGLVVAASRMRRSASSASLTPYVPKVVCVPVLMSVSMAGGSGRVDCSVISCRRPLCCRMSPTSSAMRGATAFARYCAYAVVSPGAGASH